jgi:hypothetical protein
MAAGDAQRVWFPEMLDALKQYWSKEKTWEEIAIFAHKMTEERTNLRHAKGIKPAQWRCKDCGEILDLAPITIRSCLFALRKMNAIDEEQLKQLDKDWKKYKKKNCLDGEGKKITTSR